MLSFPSSLRVFLCSQATDMRKSFDGLSGCVEQIVGQDPLNGHLFVFFNRRHTMVKMLMWDRSGFCLYSKRLEQGTFAFKKDFANYEIEIAELFLILEGIDLEKSRRRKRYRLP